MSWFSDRSPLQLSCWLHSAARPQDLQRYSHPSPMDAGSIQAAPVQLSLNYSPACHFSSFSLHMQPTGMISYSLLPKLEPLVTCQLDFLQKPHFFFATTSYFVCIHTGVTDLSLPSAFQQHILRNILSWHQLSRQFSSALPSLWVLAEHPQLKQPA